MKKTALFVCVIFVVSAFVSVEARAETVVLNTNSSIYHNPNCKWAAKCTKNCIETDKKKAKEKGARACKVCGG